MWPVPLHLGQGPNGARYSHPAQMDAAAMAARIRCAFTAAHPYLQLAAPAE